MCVRVVDAVVVVVISGESVSEYVCVSVRATVMCQRDYASVCVCVDVNGCVCVVGCV